MSANTSAHIPGDGVIAEPTGEGYDITRFHPERVLNWGFQFDIAALDTPEGLSARGILEELEAEVRSFTGRERQFVTTLRMYATSLGHGLRSRDQRKCDRIAAAKQKLTQNVENAGSDEIIGGFLNGGWRLLLLGGLVFVITHLVLENMGARSGNPAQKDPIMMPLATAIGTTFIGAYFRGWSIKRKLRRIWKEYEKELKEARDEYVEAAREEYFRCATNAAFEWREFFGFQAPSTKSLEALLFGRMQRTVEQENAGDTPEAGDTSFWQKLPLIGRFCKA